MAFLFNDLEQCFAIILYHFCCFRILKGFFDYFLGNLNNHKMTAVILHRPFNFGQLFSTWNIFISSVGPLWHIFTPCSWFLLTFLFETCLLRHFCRLIKSDYSGSIWDRPSVSSWISLLQYISLVRKDIQAFTERHIRFLPRNAYLSRASHLFCFYFGTIFVHATCHILSPGISREGFGKYTAIISIIIIIYWGAYFDPLNGK